MTDYPEKLFELELSTDRLGLRETPGFQERQQSIADYHKRICAELGLDFLDRLNTLDGEENYYARLACFRRGFRLALQLVLELPW